ncbi:MAG TPA: hypothetical protein VN946_25920 [Terriglobales bacterium]|jgi:hypothetical protein|nr:hypothetical protein [Terriglobales bacterium]
MSIQGAYRRPPEYLAGRLALLASAVVALAALSAAALEFVLGKPFHQPGNVGLALLVWFCAMPGIAVPAFVSGSITWLVSRWLLRQKFSTHSEHVIEA